MPVMNKKIGFIGAGKMGQAMIEGMIKSKMFPKENIMASAGTEKTINQLKQKYNISTSLKNIEVARFADILILAIKPDLHASVIEEIKKDILPNAIIVTIAAGISLQDLEGSFGINIKAVRSMPNTPSLVGEGMSVICSNDNLSEAEIVEVERLFQCFGKTERLEETEMDAVPAISGSSPAYVYMLIEAMADGGVRQGISREKAYRLASQAVLGAAKMVLETGLHPGQLKDNVCTPGGATIEAVATLEERQFRGAVMAAMESCTNKIRTITKKTLFVSIIDDDEIIRSMLVRIINSMDLAHFEINIEVFEDGITFFESNRLEKHGVHFLILDGVMPVMDGIEILQKVKMMKERDTYVLMLTGRKGESDIERALKLGADEYVLKPFSIKELQARIQRLITRIK